MRRIATSRRVGLGVLVSLLVVGSQGFAQEEAPEETPPPAPTPSAPAPTPRPSASAPAPSASPYGAPYWYRPTTPPAAKAEPVEDTAAEEPPLPPASPPGWFGSIGVRTEYVTDTGFDPFAENDALIQGSIGLSRRVWMQGPLSVAGALQFEFGSRKATARGEPTQLDNWRLTAGPEVRYNIVPMLFAYVRPSAGVSRTVASLDDATAQTTLYARSLDLELDGAAGLAFAFWDLRNRSGDLRFWLVGEGGYGWSSSSDLALSPDEGSGAPERTEPLDLGKLALRGPYFKVAIAASF